MKRPLSGLRYFTRDLENSPGKKAVEDLFTWKTHNIHPNQSVDPHVEAPDFWSPQALQIAERLYFRAKSKGTRENSIRDLVDRVSSFIEGSAVKQKYFVSKKERSIFIDELKFILLDQRGAFNSPVWFNAGVFQKYGLKSLGCHWKWDRKANKPVEARNLWKDPQVSACFIQGVEDTLESTYGLLKNEAQIFKYGSGSGTNFSKLKGGVSSRLLNVLRVFDESAGAIKSGGTARRAAKMVLLNSDHPEVFDFVDWKKKEEEKSRRLLKDGWSLEEVSASLSGQNSNNSVRVTDKDMKAWKNGDPKLGKLFQKICEAAWSCADPGLQFSDRIEEWNPCREIESIESSNPCAEFVFLNETSCNLASINLGRFFLDSPKKFDLESFEHTARILFIAQDILISAASYPTPEICRKTSMYRPLGLGFCNLGGLLMSMGLSYESQEARDWSALLSSTLLLVALETSSELGRALAPFPMQKKTSRGFLRVIRKHARCFFALSFEGSDLQNKKNAYETRWKKINSIQSPRFRNSQFTLMAPTGTIGLFMDVQTTGIEPEFSFHKEKRLEGGGVLTWSYQKLHEDLKRLGYPLEVIASTLKRLSSGESLQEISQLQEPHRRIFATALGPGEISSEAHLLMMASIQSFLSGAISKTINLPQNTSPQEIAQIYQRAWELGLKSISIYRDGSKGQQPLVQMECFRCS